MDLVRRPVPLAARLAAEGPVRRAASRVRWQLIGLTALIFAHAAHAADREVISCGRLDHIGLLFDLRLVSVDGRTSRLSIVSGTFRSSPVAV